MSIGLQRWSSPFLLAASVLAALAATAGTALATDRYVNSGASCPGSGTSGSPYCSFSSVNALDLAPGDRILLARGATFNTHSGPPLMLGDEDDGSSVSWNSIEPYGSGADPRIIGGSVNGSVGISGTNLDYWKFIEIEILNASAGVSLAYTTLSHQGLRFDKLYIHDMLDTNPWSGTGVYVSAASANLALSATASASSTATGYCACRVNDGIANDFNGWSNNQALPQWVQLEWGSSQTVKRVGFTTTSGYETSEFQIQYWNGSSWITPSGASITGNTQKYVTVTFPSAVSTTKVRAYVTYGKPIVDPNTARVDELSVFSDTFPVPSPSQWVAKDIQFTDNEFGPIGLYMAVDGLYSTKLETFQDIVFMRNYTHDARWDQTFRYNKNVKWIGNRNERIASGAAPFGNTDLHLWAVQDSTFVNSIFDYTYDAGVHDETFGDIAYRMDQTRFRNNLIEDAAGPGVEWHVWRTIDDYGLDPAANYYTNQELSGNAWRNNGWDTTPTAGVFEGSMSINDADINACYTLPTGSVSNNLYWEPTGFLVTNGCSNPLTMTNNLSIGSFGSIYHAGQKFSDTSCSTSPWSYESSTNGTSWTAMSTLSTVNPRTDVRCKPSSGSVPWVNRFEQYPNTGTSYTVARTWTAPSSGTISIRSRALKAELGGDGVFVRVRKNGSTDIVGQLTLGASDQTGVVLNADSVSVVAGDKIRFEVADNANNTTDRVSWSPAVAYTSGGNLAPSATTSASSTYAGYCACRVNDLSTADFNGWASADATMPEWVQLTWGSSQTVGRVEFWTTTGYVARDFQIQYWNGSSWVTPSGASITGNTEKHRTIAFTAVSTTQVRVNVTLGDAASGFARVDELEVYAG